MPAKVDTLDMVHHSEQGHVVMTTGPFLEVSLKARQESKHPTGIPGDDVIAMGGGAELRVKVQCPNWLDVNRVQVFLNGRPEKSLNFTRRETPEKFQPGVVKFEAVLPLELKSDTHVIVATIGEGLQLGRVMGAGPGRNSSRSGLQSDFCRYRRSGISSRMVTCSTCRFRNDCDCGSTCCHDGYAVCGNCPLGYSTGDPCIGM